MTRKQLQAVMEAVVRVRERLADLRDDSPQHGPPDGCGCSTNRIVLADALSRVIGDLDEPEQILRNELLAHAVSPPEASA